MPGPPVREPGRSPPGPPADPARAEGVTVGCRRGAQRDTGRRQRRADRHQRPHAARIHDQLLGGKDHYEVDRQAVGRLLSVAPGARTVLRANHAFLQRAVRHVVVGGGVRQTLAIGTVLLTA
ncbi:SAM-dependent methyltransferase, partial [Streptomyces sp. NPDC057052]|uniref:SAM-dependent methyltransferase n=1 Tax=Streptomyces sp. NPDC057052 TaxID=3346010 RepID=UPI0036397A9C